MKKNSVIRKISATFLAVATLLTVTCSTSSAAAAAKGGAIVYTGAMEGTYYENPSDAWSALASLEESAAFRLLGDWEADENGSFGEGVGFKDGAMYLEDNRNGMIIDLNGYDIDRGLEESRENGCVFYFLGCRDIVFTNLSEIRDSRIMGGYNKSNGGAFVLLGSEIMVKGIKITENKSEGRGGAFFIKEGDTSTGEELSKVTLENCLVSGNKANTGGGIFIDSTNFIWIYDSVISGNFAKKDAGIHTEVTGVFSTHIHLGGKVIIADNIAEESGTGLMLDENFLIKVSVSYVSDRPLSGDSRIEVLSKTDDASLRITADSSDNYIECYEYENDDYRIVAKGSGNDKYLAIVKN